MNAYRESDDPQASPESRWAYWRYQMSRAAGWCWGCRESWGPIAFAAVLLLVTSVLAIALVRASEERDRQHEREQMSLPCRDTITAKGCPHPEHRLVIEGDLAVCRCETLSRATGDK